MNRTGIEILALKLEAFRGLFLAQFRLSLQRNASGVRLTDRESEWLVADWPVPNVPLVTYVTFKRNAGAEGPGLVGHEPVGRHGAAAQAAAGRIAGAEAAERNGRAGTAGAGDCVR